MSLAVTTRPRTRSAIAEPVTTQESASTKKPNDVLAKYRPTGASAATARQDGLSAGPEASATMAQNDLSRLKAYQAQFEAAGKKYGLPPALLAGIASRESRGGAVLDSRGYGDQGNGYGLMQVDKRAHASLEGGPFSQEHIDQAASILKGTLSSVEKAHPDWTPEQQLRGAVAGYNSGAGNVKTVAGMDRGTTGDDYSNDVWARAQALAPSFGGAPTSSGDASAPSATSPAPGYSSVSSFEPSVGEDARDRRAAAANAGKAGPAAQASVAPSGATVDPANSTLKKLGTSPLRDGETGYCVKTTLDNMRRLGVPNTPAATGNDPNNPRGAMAQMLKKGWTSIPFEGSHQETIKSPYGTATANVVSPAQYKKLVAEGKVPDGAVIFQSRHGWDYSGGSKGNDMGIVRNGGKTTHNYKDMSGIIYKDCKSVVILVPQGAMKPSA